MRDEWLFQSTVRGFFPLWYDEWANRVTAWHEARKAEGKFVFKKTPKQIFEIIYSILSIFLVIFAALGMLIGNTIGVTGLDVMATAFAVVVPLTRYTLAFLGYSFNSVLSFFGKFRVAFNSLDPVPDDPFTLSIYRHRRMCMTAPDASNPKEWFCCAGDDVAVPASIRIGDRVWTCYRWFCAFGLLLYLMILPAVLGDSNGARVTGFIFFYLILMFPNIITLEFPLVILNRILACGWSWQSLVASASVETQQFSRSILLERRHYFFRVASTAVSILVAVICITLPLVPLFIGESERGNAPLPLPADFLHSTVAVTPPQDAQVSNLCTVKAFNLGMIQVTALAAASFHAISPDIAVAREFVSEFFPPEEARFNITDSGEMNVDEFEYGAASYFEFGALNLTVFSIRGLSSRVDTALSAQFLMSSGLLALSMPLSLFLSSTTPFTMYAIQGFLAFPVLLMRDITLIERYIKDITKYYEAIPKQSHVLFTGHAVGGGIAKILAHIYGKHSVTVSAPGVTIYNIVYDRQDGQTRDMSTAVTDIVPDLDLMAKIEVSPGVTYRVICDEGAGACHSIWHTLCMMGLMCETPHDMFCRRIPEISSLYASMIKYSRE
jgi:hypothetical protein